MTNKTITLPASGKRITVRVATYRDGLMRLISLDKVQENKNKQDGDEGQPTDEQTLLLLSSFLFVKLSNCSSGPGVPPTAAALLDMPEADLNLWVETAAEMNPSWFPSLLPEDEEENEKKE